jgi:hypothetical protein
VADCAAHCWRVPAERSRSILNDPATIFEKVSHDLRVRDIPAPEPQGLHPPVPHGVIAQTLPASSRMQKDKLKTAAAVR